MDPKQRWRRLKEGCGFKEEQTARAHSDVQNDTRSLWNLLQRSRTSTPKTLTSSFGTYTSGIMGEEVDTPYGRCFVRTTWINPDPKWDWEELTRIHARLFKPEDDRLTGTLDRWLFLDIETTGLAGGVGTLPFMIGWALYDAGGLTVYQGFLRDIDEEPALLHYLAEFLEQTAGIITYNGSSFDRHVLHNRFVINRIPFDIRERPHLDMYHWVRRVWHSRWPSITLQAVELHLLNYTREMDLKGSEIPSVYRWYLRRGWHDALYRVFEHNLDDIRSLVSLTLLLGDSLQGKGSYLEPEDQAVLTWQLGRIWLNQDWRYTVNFWYEAVKMESLPVSYRSRAVIQLLRLARRKRKYHLIDEILKCVEKYEPEKLTDRAWATAAFYAYRFKRERNRAIRWLEFALRQSNADDHQRKKWKNRQTWLRNRIQKPLGKR